MRFRAAIGIAALAAATCLAGCFSNTPADLPPIFRIDEIRYWWEGDYLIVNVTFTNQHENYTPGIDTLDPQISVLLHEETVNNDGGTIGQETSYVYGAGVNSSITVTLSNTPYYPWKARYYRSDGTGPLLIPPGRTLSIEFGLKPAYRFETELDGFYHVRVSLPSWYPDYYYQSEFQGEGDAAYETGCFNRVVKEFYGVNETGPDCRVWDCTGERTDSGYGGSRGIKDSYKPKCTATQHTGPDYD